MNDDQNFWNFLFSTIFVALTAAGAWHLYKLGNLPTSISFFDLALITLATFRLIRLVTKDKVFQFFRDFFLEKNVVEGATELLVIRQKPLSGPQRTISELLACPWCIGVWIALGVTFFYYYSPFAWFPILILAIAGVASFIQILINEIGWKAEYYKREVGGE